MSYFSPLLKGARALSLYPLFAGADSCHFSPLLKGARALSPGLARTASYSSISVPFSKGRAPYLSSVGSGVGCASDFSPLLKGARALSPEASGPPLVVSISVPFSKGRAPYPRQDARDRRRDVISCPFSKRRAR